MRWSVLVSALLLAGCAKHVPVRIDLEAVAPAPSAHEILPKFVELQHESQGWVHVDIAGEERIARRLADGSVELATATLPPGRYEAVRFAYLAARPEVAVDAAAPADAADAAVPAFPFDRPEPLPGAAEWVPAEALILQQFCLGGPDPLSTIVLQVGRAQVGEAVPTRVTLEAPACGAERVSMK